MAGSIYVPLKTVFDDSGLKKAQKGVGGLGKSLKSALGGLGVAASLGAVTAYLNAAGKAAAQDNKSFQVLANTLKNVTGASDGAIRSADDYIQKLQMQVGIADDQLRPVFGKLVTITGDLTKSQGLLALAADLAASKNIDLSTAGNALAKAVSGQTTALFKLAPELKKSSDWMTTLKNNTAGAAEIAANADPYQRLTIIFGEMQEKIGMALLPTIQKLADYVASEEFQGAFAAVAEDFNNFVTGLDAVATIVETNIGRMNNALKSFGLNVDIAGIVKKLFGPLTIPGVGSLFDLITSIGAKTNAAAKLAAGSGVNTTTLEGILKASGSLKTFTDTSTTAAKGATKVKQANTALADAAKAAAEALQKQIDAYWEAVKAADEFMASVKDVTAGFVSMFKVAPKMGEFESAVVSGFEEIYSSIKSALKDNLILKSAGKALTDFADSSISAMKAIAKQRDILADKIDVARTITAGVTGLANITSMLDTVTESVTSSVRTMANGIETIITKTTDVTTSGGLVDNFQKLVDKTKNFAKNLIDLKKLGLNKNLFAQLVTAGADAGGATAQALVDGGADTIGALNDLYRELDITAGEIAQNTTDIMYEVGQQIISNGFIEGLVSQSEALAATAQAMAQTFADAFNAQMIAALNAALPAQPTLKIPVLASSMDTYDVAKQLGGVTQPLSAENIRFAQVAQRTGATVNVTVNAGLGTNGQTVATDIVNVLKKYERSNGSVWVAAQ